MAWEASLMASPGFMEYVFHISCLWLGLRDILGKAYTSPWIKAPVLPIALFHLSSGPDLLEVSQFIPAFPARK